MASSSRPKLEYKKNDRVLLTDYCTAVAGWRRDISLLDKKFCLAKSSAELKKVSSSLDLEFKKYLKSSEAINMDQKFFQFNHQMSILEKQLKDLKDAHMDETYQDIFNTLQQSITTQLTHERSLQKTVIAFLALLNNPEFAENTTFLEDIKNIIEQKILLLTKYSEQIVIGKNQRASNLIQDMQFKFERWTRKIPRLIQQYDDLTIKLKERDSHFHTLDKKLNELNPLASLDRFPTLKESHHHLTMLLQKMDKYKKALAILLNKIQHGTKELNSYVSQSHGMLIDKKQKFQKIFGALADEYQTILKEVMSLEDEAKACHHVLKDANTKCNNKFSKEMKLCEELKETLKAHTKHFANCYQILTIEKSENFRDEQNKILRVNYLLQSIYDNLTIIEDELQSAGCDNSGITLFKNEFASILINNTIHEEDLNKPIKKYLEWLHYLETSDVIHTHSPKFFEAIRHCRADIKRARDELISWRTGTTSYVVSTTMRVFSPAVFTMLAIVLPGANLLPNDLAQNAMLMDKLQTATKTVVKIGGKTAYKKVADTLSPTRSENNEEFPEEESPHKEMKIAIAGKQNIKTPKDDCKLSLDLSYLWRDTLIVKIQKAVFNKSMVLTGISASISLALGFTGVGTILALGLLTGGTALGTMSMTAYDEYQQCVSEAKIRFQSLDRLKKIDIAIRSLESVPERHALNKYFAFTMDFIRRFVIETRYGKDNLNVETSLVQMLDYLATILNIPSTDLRQSTPQCEINIEVKRQDLEPLLHFLKTEAEGKEGLRVAIKSLKVVSGTEEKSIGKTLEIARRYIVQLEGILKTLHINCHIGKTPLQKSFDILRECQPKLAPNNRFFKSTDTADFLQIQHSLTLLLGDVNINVNSDEIETRPSMVRC